MLENEKKKDWITLLTFIIAIFTVIFQVFQPKTQKDQIVSMFWFVVIILYIGLLYAINFYGKKIKNFFERIDRIDKDILKLKKQMNEEKRFAEIEKKLAVLEVLKGKKSQIDPRIIFLIILLIFVYFYLRSIGVLP